MADSSCCPPVGPFTLNPLAPCPPGPVTYPACYTVPPGDAVFQGFKQLTINPDCTVASVVILDSMAVPVPGAVESACPGSDGCCDAGSLCGILSGLPTQVPGITDTALFVTPAGCFLGVPGGGGGGFPGYGVPVTTACANAPGVSLLVSRADHVHRSALPIQLAGALIGTRCSLNFISPASATVTPTVLVVDNPGLDRVDVTINAQQILNVFEDAVLIATNPDEIHFEDGLLATVSSPTVHVNLDYGGAGAPVSAAAAVAGVATTVSRSDHTHLVLTGVPVAIGIANAAGAATTLARSDHVHRGAVPVAENGSPVATEPGLNFIEGTDISLTVVDDPGNNQVNVTITSLATSFPGYGVPVSTAQANSAGVSGLAARADHVHRTIVQFLDAGILISSRPSVNFIDGTGITVAVVDNAGLDRADITITGVVSGFATPTVAADAAVATGGVATTAIRSDAKLQVATGTPVATAQANAAGVATTLARSDHVHRTILQVQEEGVLVGSRPTINFIGAAVTAVDNGGSDRVDITVTASAAAFIQRFTFQADQFDSPVTANWAVNALAPAAADTLNSALIVRRFDDTTEEGVGGLVTVPTGAVNVTFYFKWRAQTAPGGAAGVVLTYYTRSIPDNAAVGAWSAAVNFTTLVTATNTNFQYDSQTISLATLGWTAGTLRQFEITRRGTQAGDTLAGDFDLVEMIMEFTT